MIFQQYYLDSLSQASYLIGDEESHLAVVVDPQRDIDHYLEVLANDRLQLRYVLLTHFYADFVAEHLELRHRTGAEICLGSKAQASYPFRPLPLVLPQIVDTSEKRENAQVGGPYRD